MVARIPTVGGNLGILKTSVKTQYRPDIPTDADFILRLTVTMTRTVRLIGWWPAQAWCVRVYIMASAMQLARGNSTP